MKAIPKEETSPEEAFPCRKRRGRRESKHRKNPSQSGEKKEKRGRCCLTCSGRRRGKRKRSFKKA